MPDAPAGKVLYYPVIIGERDGGWVFCSRYYIESFPELNSGIGWRRIIAEAEVARVPTPLCEACYDETDEAAYHRRQSAIRAAADRLGIRHQGFITLDGYGRHPRADEILAEMAIPDREGVDR